VGGVVGGAGTVWDPGLELPLPQLVAKKSAPNKHSVAMTTPKLVNLVFIKIPFSWFRKKLS
jgi:hypothetical protein